MPLKGAANIPIGSQLDTAKGRVALTSAADTGGKKTQTSEFYDGHLPGQADGAQEEAQEAKALITDLVHEGSDRRSRSARR